MASLETAPSATAGSQDGKPIPLLLALEDKQTSRLLKQGAEAKVYSCAGLGIDQPAYITTLDGSFPAAQAEAQAGPGPGTAASRSSQAQAHSSPALLLKYRFPKHYRHPTLSVSLTAQRTTMEARALQRCARAGVRVPGVRCLDERTGVLGMEWIEGRSVREWLGGGAEGDEEDLIDQEEEDEEAEGEEEEEEGPAELSEEQKRERYLVAG